MNQVTDFLAKEMIPWVFLLAFTLVLTAPYTPASQVWNPTVVHQWGLYTFTLAGFLVLVLCALKVLHRR